MPRNALKLLLAALLLTTPAFAAGQAEVKVGTHVEKFEIQGAAESFTVAPNTKLYAGAKVSGVEDDKVTVVFLRNGAESSKVELKVPRSPYRTYAYRTMRAGDSGTWTVKVLGPDGTELGSTHFTVTVSG